VVAVAAPLAGLAARQRDRPWLIASLVVLLLGLGARWLLGGGGVGDRSAAVMLLILTIGVWLATALLSSARTAFFVTLALVLVVDVAALPARNPPEFDDREALFRPEQRLASTVPVPGTSLADPVLTVLVEPVWATVEHPPFGLAAEINGTAVGWECPFQRGRQKVALPLPPTLRPSPGASLDVQLYLTGDPRRESDYVLVYASSARGGFLVDLNSAAAVAASATPCVLR
jgi:hypothetical protein